MDLKPVNQSTKNLDKVTDDLERIANELTSIRKIVGLQAQMAIQSWFPQEVMNSDSPHEYLRKITKLTEE